MAYLLEQTYNWLFQPPVYWHSPHHVVNPFHNRLSVFFVFFLGASSCFLHLNHFPQRSLTCVCFLVMTYDQLKHLGCHTCHRISAAVTSWMAPILRLAERQPSTTHSSGSVEWSLHGHHTPLMSNCSGSRSCLRPLPWQSLVNMLLPGLLLCLSCLARTSFSSQVFDETPQLRTHWSVC